MKKINRYLLVEYYLAILIGMLLGGFVNISRARDGEKGVKLMNDRRLCKLL